MEKINVSQARTNLYQLVSQTAKSNQPVTITSKNGNAVLISEEDWNSINETMYLNSIPGMMESIVTAAHADDSEFVNADEVEW